MTTTTFGFDAVQDRIWMRVHEQGQTVWLTRRMVGGFLGPVIQNFERATPGEQGVRRRRPERPSNTIFP